VSVKGIPETPETHDDGSEPAEARLLAAAGMLGYGIREKSLGLGMQLKPHALVCDAGSTDQGPYDLGSGDLHMPRGATRRDLKLMLRAARLAQIPMIVGSCGGAGVDEQLRVYRELVEEIAEEEGIHFRLAIIRSEQDKGYLRRQLADGAISALDNAPPVSEATLDSSLHIVAVMGAEPIMEALRRGADVVLAGRSTDTALYAAVPLLRGLPPGPVWHAAKLLECGGSSAMPPSASDCLFATVRSDHFVVEPPNPDLYCTPLSAAAHTLYENASPFHMREPSGTLDTTECRHVQSSPRAVSVYGSRFLPERYTVKLEGAELAGFRAITIGGIREPRLLAELDDYLARLRASVQLRVSELFDNVSADDYELIFHQYGRDGVMGHLEPNRAAMPHEIGLLIIAVAQTRSLAKEIIAIARAYALHSPYKGSAGLVSNMAFPISPEIECGPAYRFTLNHVLALEDPLEPFPIEMVEV
jgi:hypothetical protein